VRYLPAANVKFALRSESILLSAKGDSDFSAYASIFLRKTVRAARASGAGEISPRGGEIKVAFRLGRKAAFIKKENDDGKNKEKAAWGDALYRGEGGGVYTLYIDALCYGGVGCRCGADVQCRDILDAD
jgi:hypothetical protein